MIDLSNFAKLVKGKLDSFFALIGAPYNPNNYSIDDRASVPHEGEKEKAFAKVLPMEKLGKKKRF